MINVVLILLVCGLLVLTVRWDRARQQRRDYDEDGNRLHVPPEYEVGGLSMPRLYVQGMNGQIEVDDEWVRIHRRGLGGHLTRGIFGLFGLGVQIHLGDIEDIEISYPRFYVRGWIRFLTGGEDRIGIQEAAKDPKTVLFTGRKQAEFDEFRQQVKALIAHRGDERLAEMIAASLPASASGGADFATQLRELASLRDDGLLTEEEFQTKKAQLLSAS